MNHLLFLSEPSNEVYTAQATAYLQKRPPGSADFFFVDLFFLENLRQLTIRKSNESSELDPFVQAWERTVQFERDICEKNGRIPLDVEAYVLPSRNWDTSTTCTRTILEYGECWSLEAHFYTRDDTEGNEFLTSIGEDEMKAMLRITKGRNKIVFSGNGEDIHYDRIFVKRKLEEILTARQLIKKVIVTCPCAVLQGLTRRLVDIPGTNELNKAILCEETARASTVIVYTEKCLREDTLIALRPLYGPKFKHRQFVFIRSNRKDEQMFMSKQRRRAIRPEDEKWRARTEHDIFRHLLRGVDETVAREYFEKSTTMFTCYITAFTSLHLSPRWRTENPALCKKLYAMCGGFKALGKGCLENFGDFRKRKFESLILKF